MNAVTFFDSQLLGDIRHPSKDQLGDIFLDLFGITTKDGRLDELGLRREPLDQS